MKAKSSVSALLFGIVFMLLAFQEPSLKKRITDTKFRYEFYTTKNTPDVKEQRVYYWFKGGAIHSSENGIAGELLHNEYEKFYLSNQLAEKGAFAEGLKNGIWKTWHQNGNLDSKQDWSNGLKNGSYFSYDANGKLMESGRYRRGKKHGRWINFLSKDTIQYKNDKVFVKAPKKTKEQRKLEKETKKAADSLKKENKKKEKALKKAAAEAKKTPGDKNKKSTDPKKKASVTPTQKKEVEKEGFFKRLFSKKEKKPTPNGTGQ